jgi:plastocyanin
MQGQEYVPEQATAKVGQDITAKVDQPGRVEYVCTIHLGMTAAIDVSR